MTVDGVLLSGIVGSTAYGLAHEGSDIDRLGVFAAPTVSLHGLHRPKESHVTKDPDVTLHEAAKWCRLALGGNPTASELVWLPDELYEVRTPLGDELIGIRSAFLSAERVRNAYLGYATQQFRRLQAAEPDASADADAGAGRTAKAGAGTHSGVDVDVEADVDADLASAGRARARARTAKHARHLARLCLQGYELYATGTLTLRLADPEECRRFGERVADDPAVALSLVREYESLFDRTRSVLPERPDEAAAESWLRRVRAHFYDPADLSFAHGA